MIDVALRIASQFAPGLVRRLAGDKAGDVAESILSIGGLVTGEQDPEAIAAALEADAAKAHEFRMQAAQIDLELAHMDHRNTADARARDVAMIEAGRNNTRADVLAYGALAGVMALILVVIFVKPADAWVQGMVGTIVGFLTKAALDVYNFEFGSSRGSKNKEAQLDRLTGGGNRGAGS